jgi:hypothetical protein
MISRKRVGKIDKFCKERSFLLKKTAIFNDIHFQINPIFNNNLIPGLNKHMQKKEAPYRTS